VSVRPTNEGLDIGQSATLTDVAMCVNHYRLSTPGLYVCVHVPVQLDKDTRIILGLIAQGGRGKFKQCDPGDYKFFTGPPNFVFDVFREGQEEEYKFRQKCFEENGVIEYVVWPTYYDRPIWHRLVDGRFQEIEADEEGLIKSTALPGLWIPVEAFVNRDWWAVMASISRGITRRGHRDFMATIWRD
jgi:hypothetical protein